MKKKIYWLCGGVSGLLVGLAILTLISLDALSTHFISSFTLDHA